MNIEDQLCAVGFIVGAVLGWIVGPFGPGWLIGGFAGAGVGWIFGAHAGQS